MAFAAAAVLSLLVSVASADEFRFLDIPWLTRANKVKAIIAEKVTQDEPVGGFELSTWAQTSYRGGGNEVQEVPMYKLEYSREGGYTIDGFTIKSIELEFVPSGLGGTYSDKGTDGYLLTLARYNYGANESREVSDETSGGTEEISGGMGGAGYGTSGASNGTSGASNGTSGANNSANDDNAGTEEIGDYPAVYAALEQKLRAQYGEPAYTIDKTDYNPFFSYTDKELIWGGDEDTIVKLVYFTASSSTMSGSSSSSEDVYITYAYGAEWFFEEKAALKLVSENANNLDVGQD